MSNNSYPLVSIGIPTFNRADSYLKECIESVTRQTYPKIEIIVSDNCSNDNTKDLVAGFSDPRIRYNRHSNNMGANYNINYIIKQARGDYFLLLCDDDLIDPDFVETCMQASGYQKGIGLIRTGTRLINAEGQTIASIPNDVVGLSTEDFFLGWFTHKTSLYPCSTLFYTHYLKNIGGFSSRHDLFHDVMAEVRIASAHGRIDVKDVKASFRRHADEMTFAAKVKDWCEDSFELLNIMQDLSTEKKDLIRKKGLQFFTQLNFNRAMAVKLPAARFRALLIVLNQFEYSYFALGRFSHCCRASIKQISKSMLSQLRAKKTKKTT